MPSAGVGGINRKVPAFKELIVHHRREAVKRWQYNERAAAVSARCHRELTEAQRRDPQLSVTSGKAYFPVERVSLSGRVQVYDCCSTMISNSFHSQKCCTLVDTFCDHLITRKYGGKWQGVGYRKAFQLEGMVGRNKGRDFLTICKSLSKDEMQSDSRCRQEWC